MTFSDYIEQLASQHKSIKHSAQECHYSDLHEDAQNAFSHMRMHYPCVVLDEAGTVFSGSDSQPYDTDIYNILFLDHVRDTGDATEIRGTFERMKEVAKDFLRRMIRDRKTVKLMNRFSVVDVEMERVFLEAAALYGYVVTLKNTALFLELDCNKAFEEEEEE
jgi:hypothetical protein